MPTKNQQRRARRNEAKRAALERSAAEAAPSAAVPPKPPAPPTPVLWMLLTGSPCTIGAMERMHRWVESTQPPVLKIYTGPRINARQSAAMLAGRCGSGAPITFTCLGDRPWDGNHDIAMTTIQELRVVMANLTRGGANGVSPSATVVVAPMRVMRAFAEVLRQDLPPLFERSGVWSPDLDARDLDARDLDASRVTSRIAEWALLDGGPLGREADAEIDVLLAT